MKLLNMDYHEVRTSAGFIIEYRDSPFPSVRILYHESDDENPDVRYIFVANRIQSCPNDWCPLDDFLNQLQPNVIPNWRIACRIRDNCPIISRGKKN